MGPYTDITVDLSDLFDGLDSKDKAFLINQNIEHADTDELITELQNRGYVAEEIGKDNTDDLVAELQSRGYDVVERHH